MNAYLGVVPKVKQSGDKNHSGRINRASRKLARTMLTQSLIHVADASPYFRNFYDGLKSARGAGRARIALIRKLCMIMRRMLLDGEKFRFIKLELYQQKLTKYEKDLKRLSQFRESA